MRFFYPLGIWFGTKQEVGRSNPLPQRACVLENAFGACPFPVYPLRSLFRMAWNRFFFD